MEIQNKETVYLIEEIPTDGHSPLKFMCNDSKIYYCKYRVSPKDVEIDCLIYEVVCNGLLKKLDIPTPEIAFVKITEDSYNKQDLKRNRLYIQPGVICFGSKEIENAQLVTELDKISDENDFKKYTNPDDLIRIALFDLWVGNMDRGKGDSNFTPGRSNNYNLLSKPEGNKSKLLAFDHGFTFDGEHSFRIFNEHFSPSLSGKLFGTQFFRDMLNYIPVEKRLKIVNKFIASIKTLNIDELLTALFSKMPFDWKRHDPLKEKMITYLKSEERIKSLAKIAENEIINFGV